MRKIYLTVDTECHNVDQVNQYFYGKVGNKEYGVKKILELAKELDIPVNFFLDVVECRKYGDKHIEEIVSLIKSYGQPVFFHLHPDFVSGDERSYLWEYNDNEKLDIIQKGIDDYQRLAENTDNIVFRAGRYGVDSSVYEALAKTGKIKLDLSYCCNDSKMCHLKPDEVSTMNAPTTIKGVNVLPNTRYVGLSLFGKTKCFNLDTADSTKNEFFSFIDKTKLNTVVWTMHSWNFIKKWFFAKSYIKGNDYEVKKFKKCVEFAKKKGFTFGNLNDYTHCEEPDELLNLCEGFTGKIKCIINNFLRFRKIGCLTKKYFLAYHFFYFILLCLVAAIILGIIIF